MAEKQTRRRSRALDINVGTRVPKAERADVMKWLVEAAREVTDKPLSIDNPSLETVRVGVQAAMPRKAARSSTPPPARRTSWRRSWRWPTSSTPGIVGLAIDENGVAATTDGEGGDRHAHPGRRHGSRSAASRTFTSIRSSCR